jgi:hypothetical protein
VPSTLRMISLYFPYLSLKVMAREDHERRTKHRESAGASSSSRAPTAQPKKLAKCLDPATFFRTPLLRIPLLAVAPLTLLKNLSA